MSGEAAHVDRSTAWVAFASVVLGILDAATTVLCLQFGVTTAEFGTATLATAMFPIIDRLGGAGLGAAVIREPHPDPAAQASVFWLGFGAALALLGALVVLNPVIGRLLDNRVVGTLLIAYTARLLFQHVSIVPTAMMKRDLRYRELSIVRVIGSFAETVVKLGFAWIGTHGHRDLAIWCFILGPMAASFVTTVGTLICYPWRPRFAFRRDVAGRAARFTASYSGGELLYFAYTNADYMVVGANFGSAAVGVYRLAYELVLDVVRMLSLVTTEVAFPMFVRVAGDPAALTAQLLRFTRQNLVVLAPFLVYVGIEADDLLDLLFTVTSPAAAAAARVLCVVGAFRTLGFILPALLAGVGRPSRVLAYNTVASIVMPVAFVLAAMIAPGQQYVGIAWAWAAGYPIAFGLLLAMALPHAGLTIGAYLRSLGGVTGCALGALVAGVALRLVLPAWPLARLIGVAVVVLGVFVWALARFEGITLRGIARSLRGNKGEAPPPAAGP